MVFSTYLFLFYFLPLVLLVYYALPRVARIFSAGDEFVSRGRNAWLLVMSCVFYGWWNPWFILLMLFVTSVNYGCGWMIAQTGATQRRRLAGLTAAVVLSLGTLCFFKYFTFFQTNLNTLLGWMGADGLRVLEITLPMGISFYVFQALSYTLDVYRGVAPRARSWSDFACYIALFPQLVAGPIIRYNTVAEQLVERSPTAERIASGVALFVLGLAKKVCLANPIGTVADAAFGAQALAPIDAWWGVVAYAFQIYFDFSGYSDMAVGLGRMLGFEFMKNFDSPYHAESITDFWRRWHISLSTFLRDYLYFPLGGNRLGPRRTYVNLAVVMLLGGLWHGANWTFVVWGAYHGAWLAFERWLGKQSPCQRLPQPFRVAFTFVLVLFSWVLFRCDTLPEAVRYFGMMFGAADPSDPAATLLAAQLYGRGNLIVMVLAAGLVAGPVQAHAWVQQLTWRKALVIGPVFALGVLTLFAQAFNPFLYFQF